jgi:hypothetical protein
LGVVTAVGFDEPELPVLLPADGFGDPPEFPDAVDEVMTLFPEIDEVVKAVEASAERT